MCLVFGGCVCGSMDTEEEVKIIVWMNVREGVNSKLLILVV